MNRRLFLKLAGLASVALALPKTEHPVPQKPTIKIDFPEAHGQDCWRIIGTDPGFGSIGSRFTFYDASGRAVNTGVVTEVG